MRVLILIFSIAILGSCTAEAPKLKLNRNERAYVDSLYSREIPVLDSILEEQCKMINDRDYQRLKDSIIQIRLKEIEAIRN